MAAHWEQRESAPERQQLPSISSLTNGAPPPPPLTASPSSTGHSPSQSSDTRDSGNWSMTSASNHSSFSSPMTLAPIGADHKMNRSSILNPEPMHEVNHHSSLGHINQPHQPPTAHTHSPSQSTLMSNHSTTSLQHNNAPNTSYPRDDTASPTASRRSSFDTRLGNLAINSPHAGTPAATSQVSLASQLQRERSGGHQGSPAPSILENNHGHGPFTPISPSSHFPSASISSAGSGGGPRSSYGSWTAPVTSGPDRPGGRIAPPIVGSARYPYPHPNAPSPTKGFPYAFPDPDFAGPPDSEPDSRSSSVARPAPPQQQQQQQQPGGPAGLQQPSTNIHPKNPYGPQIDHYPPPGQQSQSSLFSQTSNGSVVSSNHPRYSQGSLHDLHHHHHIQRLNGASNLDSPPATPYSRTPELRVSHKLAERKRRKEMKELFDELRDSLPAERGGKSSKWEVLTKAIEFITQIRQINDNLSSKNESLQMEVNQLKSEIQSYRSGQPNGGYSQQQHHHMQRAPMSPDPSNQMQGIERSGY